MSYWVEHADCREALSSLKDSTIDAVVTDPPYELSMARWDSSGVAFDPTVWQQVLRVLKPGGFLLAFGATRLYHRLACVVEDSGFTIKDCFQWLYGTGWPKGLSLGKTLDEYQGWNTGIKPACELICVAQRPMSERRIIDNVKRWGVGAFNIGACRIPHDEPLKITKRTSDKFSGRVLNLGRSGHYRQEVEMASASPEGRWPANVILDAEATQLLDAQAGIRTSGSRKAGVRQGLGYHGGAKGDGGPALVGSSGGASRFFYCPKASKAERQEGLSEGLRNDHTTIKPIALMRWLVRLVTPPGGLVLDPFTGSGTTGVAALREGMCFYGMEQDESSHVIAGCRLRNATA